MNVAIFNYSSSGLFHYAACLVNAIAIQPDVRVLFFTSRDNNLGLVHDSPAVRVTLHAAPHRLPAFFRWCLNLREQIALWRELRDFRPDVVHITDSYGIYLLHAWWLWRYPIIFTQHDPTPHRGDVFRWSSRVIGAVQRGVSTTVVVHGEVLKKYVSTRLRVPAKKIAVIPHGDYSFFLRWQKVGTTPLPQSVLFFGRVVAYKGLDVLLASIGELQDNFPVKLIVAGSGDLSPYREMLGAVRDKMVVNRFIPDGEVIHYFQMSRVVVLPYYEASQSGVVPIAWPARVPVIATNVGGLADILRDGDNALLVPPGDSGTLTAALQRVLSDEGLRARLIAGGLRTVTNTISWSRVGRQYMELYRRLL